MLLIMKFRMKAATINIEDNLKRKASFISFEDFHQHINYLLTY